MDYAGAVRGLLGGKNWNKSKFNRATQSKRQLGSVFKTYVYLTALSAGYKLSDKIKDLPLKKNNWSPKNFSDKYEGIISIERAFAISSNVAAVRLADKIGRESIIKQTKKLGVISNISDNPSMALGVASFSLIETVGSFGAICGYGIPVIPYGIEEIKQRDNLSIWQRNFPNRKEIISKKIQFKIKKLLRAVINEGTGKKVSKIPVDIIGKTGTSQKNRDAWFIGCAKDHVVGVWVGRDDDKSMKNVFGSTIPLDIFKEIILAL
jgi:penicillin-binding protein 1A